jgi:hypothetical protein
MPQGALQANVATNPSLARAPLTVDASGNLLTGSGSLSKLNQTGTFLVKGSAGRICKINVVGGTTGGVATANIVASLTSAQAAVGTTIPLDFPCLAGIVVQAGTAVVAVSFD